VLARTDAESAKLITADVDERDREFITGERTAEGFYRLKPGTGLRTASKRGIAFREVRRLAVVGNLDADLEEAKEFAEACTRSIRQDARLQLLAVVQLGSQHRQGDHRQNSSARSARGYNSSL